MISNPLKPKLRLRKRDIRKAVWIAVFTLVAVITIIGTVSPYLTGTN